MSKDGGPILPRGFFASQRSSYVICPISVEESEKNLGIWILRASKAAQSDLYSIEQVHQPVEVAFFLRVSQGLAESDSTDYVGGDRSRKI